MEERKMLDQKVIGKRNEDKEEKKKTLGKEKRSIVVYGKIEKHVVTTAKTCHNGMVT